MSRWLTPYRRHVLRQGPAAAARAFARSRARARNVPDPDPVLAPGEALALDPLLDATPAELAAHARVLSEPRGEVRSVQWFVPWFHNPHGGGIATILRFARHFAEQGARQRFHVFDRDERPPVELPGEVTTRGAALAPADVAIATSWNSAYALLKFNDTRAKFFFVQDFEPEFHPAGSASALLEAVRELRIPGIVNTPGLAQVYGGDSVAFTPAVDHAVYFPPDRPRPERPVRIFFYARPQTARNAFALGLRTLRLVKERYGAAVEIVTAGEDFHPGAYGALDVLTNLGALGSPREVADLYRSAHVGVVFMFTAHPSYQPFEFMACETATVSNANPHTAWLLEHERNALLAPPWPSHLAEQIGRVVEDARLRERIAAAGREQVGALRWEPELQRVWAWMTRGGRA